MIKKIGFFTSIILLISCSTNKEFVQKRSTGITSFTEGDYSTALTKFTELINDAEQKGSIANLEDYEGAGKSAHALGLNEKALVFLERAKDLNSIDEKVYYALADIYFLNDNLSKEVRYLEYYKKNYPSGEFIKKINLRLFEAYVESESWEQGLTIWPMVKDEVEYHELLTEGYFKINQALENDAECEKTAKELIRINSNNTLALKFIAERYFWKAEKLYQKEMAAYNKKKTNSQYVKLLKALNIVTADFKHSRDYFEKLFKANPLPEYAHFLANIYTRLDDKAKAKFYQSKAE